MESSHSGESKNGLTNDGDDENNFCTKNRKKTSIHMTRTMTNPMSVY